jgi:hypothetical protein
VNEIRLLRACGLPVNVHTVRGLMLGHLHHHAPEIFTAKASDGSVFTCSDSFVRSFLKHRLNFVPRAGTRAAQKIPVDAEEQMRRSFFRIVYTTRSKRIKHAALRVNFDQTQVIVQSIGNSTFAEMGSKQVSILGKEEKRAWTAVVAVSASGEVLPLQIVMKGKTKKSVPPPSAPFMKAANARGFIWSFNPATYWSSLPLMKIYFDRIIVPYFERKKRELGYSPDQVCIVQLDCWSVHRSEAFRAWVRKHHPWIVLDFVPGGCTGLWQVCDVGIQRPFKQSIRRGQLDDIVAETMRHLEDGVSPAEMRVAKEIGELRERCVRWFVDAFDTINNPALIRRAWERCTVGAFNLSFESVTSDDAVDALLDLPVADPGLWAELTRGADDQTADGSFADVDDIPESTATPFDEGDASGLEEVGDSGADPAEQIAQFIAAGSTLPTNVAALGLADTMEPGELIISQVPQQADFGRGKRRKTQNKLYSEFDAH